MSFKIKDLTKSYYLITVELLSYPNLYLHYTKKKVPSNDSPDFEIDSTSYNEDEAELFDTAEEAIEVAERLNKVWSCEKVLVNQFDVEDYEYDVIKVVKK